MFCPKCGTKNPETGKFCRKCGIDISNLNDTISGNLSSLTHSSKKSKVSWESAI